jgi:hypothetical protein
MGIVLVGELKWITSFLPRFIKCIFFVGMGNKGVLRVKGK